jgi:hypothetical protein
MRIKAANPRLAQPSPMTSHVRTAKPAAQHAHPYALPHRLEPDFARVLDYWRGLLRGSATMPFADDLQLTDLPDLKGRLFVLDVFDRPQRFRAAILGDALSADGLAGAYLDEARLPRPFEFLASQCAATTECREPTFYRHETAPPYARLLLPLWGEGRISTLLGALDRN